jgi:HPt (histidine-containing phosphotransfer) domain-containing protein
MPLFVMSLFMIYRLARLIFQRARGAAIALLGISALIGAMFNDVLVWMDTYSFLYIGHYGMIAFIFAQSLVVGSNFAFAFRTADKLSRDLKIEVDRQTRDVKTILKNINQGILTVRTGLKIGDDYSACLSSILECERVAGEDVRSLILAKSNLTNEQRDLVASILTGCLDESPLNFELNSDNLPREIIFHGQEGKAKYLLVDWCPVVDEKRDLIEKILVTLRDITELKVMEEAHKAQRRDMDLIGEIIEVPVDRFDQFMSSSRNFLSENKRLMESMGNVADFSILKLLFINMHTIKGAARTYHFSRMTSVVHDCEQNLASVQKGFQAWDKKQAWDDLRAVESVFLEYEHIHQEKLKRSDGKESVRVDLETVRENIRALDSIGHLTLDADMTPFVDQVRRTFFQLYYTNLENILRELGKCLPTLARDLSKADPVVQIQALGFGINREGADALRHTFVHIFRNIMDHGIEEPEVRQKNGKPLHGLIRLEARSLGEQAILIEVSDDGRGLHLDRIKELALKRGVISETGQSTPEEVAELIFQDGFSTAKCVTDISGRGVGMSAVREYIEKIGGKVFIVLKDKPDTRSYVSFVLCIELPASVCTLEQNIKEVA